MRPSISAIATTLVAVFAVAAVGCGDPETREVQPQLWVGGDLSSANALSFGQVPIGFPEEKVVTLQAMNSAAVRIDGVDIKAGDSGSAQAFTLDPAPPFVVPGGGKVDMKVRFLPLEARSYVAQVKLTSNAKDRREVSFSAAGEGVEGKLEIAACDPANCDATRVSPPDVWDFGQVRAGSFHKARIVLFNGGGDAIDIRGVALEGASSGFRLPAGVDGERTLGRGEGFHFDVEFEPPAGTQGAAAAEVVVTVAGGEGRLGMGLVAEVQPNEAPQACLYVAELHRPGEATRSFGPDDGIPAIEPADTVILDVAAREGCTGDAEDPFDALRLDWAVTEAPGRTPQLEAVGGRPSRRSFVPERTGRHVVELTVTDTLGLSDVATLDFDVSFSRDIAVEMVWPDSPRVDLDLHLIRANGRFFDEFDDAYFGNFNQQGVGPMWPGGSPVLLFDDQGTRGLFETLTLDGAEGGKVYDVYVHYYEDKRDRRNATSCVSTSACTGGLVCSAGRCMEPVGIEVQLFLKGNEPIRLEGGVEGPCDVWHVGQVTWPTQGGRPSFSLVDRMGAEGILQGAVCTPP